MFSIFNKDLTVHEINNFIEDTDPTNYVNLDTITIHCEQFMRRMNDNCWKPTNIHSITETSQIISKICSFTNTFSDIVTLSFSSLKLCLDLTVTNNHYLHPVFQVYLIDPHQLKLAKS